MRRGRAAVGVALAALAVLIAVPVVGNPGGQFAPIPPPPFVDERERALGERLFSDPRLSANGATSCASCHDLASNGASGLPRDRAQGGGEQRFNTPTVFNAALAYRLNWEGRHRDLEAHVDALMDNPAIMGGDADGAARRLAGDPDLAAEFRAVYGRPADPDAIAAALAAFERTLVTPGARFDRWLAGEPEVLTPTEIEGFRLFRSVGCVACHQGVLVGGNLTQRQGVFAPLVPGPPEVVRVPSLRNVAATAPYLHDGSAATLSDAVRAMARAQLGASLAEADVARIAAFLHTLTGTYRGERVHPR